MVAPNNERKITQKRLREVLNYDPETGYFTWQVERAIHIHIGMRAGCINRTGYRFIKIDYVYYTEHRLAFLYMTGKWPKQCVDHIDLRKDNNAWDNLRDATISENVWNRPKKSTNTSGFKGVSWDKSVKKWRASIGKHRKVQCLGFFDSKEDAGKAYSAAAPDFHGEFARTE